MSGRAVVLSGIRVVGPDGVRPGPLRLSEGRISGEPAAAGDQVLSLPDHLVFPGLVNAHDHLTLDAFPDLPELGTFASAYDWIDAVQPTLASPVFRAARQVDECDRARQGALKNLLSGVTTVAHHDPWLPVMGEEMFPVRVVFPYGWCHSARLAGRYGPGIVESRDATPPGARWFVHLAEGTDEEARSERARLDALGVLGPDTVAIHGVGLDEEDTERLLSLGAGLVWCPTSNLKILGRTLDPRRRVDAGRLALGTDSRLSGSRDLLDELRAARDASDLTPSELLRLVTTDAARVLGLRDAGRLEPGDPADLLVVREPGGDPRAALLSLVRGDLRAVAVSGVPRVADPDLGSWFEAAGEPGRQARVDGAAKLVDARVFPRAAVTLEPGLLLD